MLWLEVKVCSICPTFLSFGPLTWPICSSIHSQDCPGDVYGCCFMNKFQNRKIINNRSLRTPYSQIKITVLLHFRERMFSIFHFSHFTFPVQLLGNWQQVFSHVLCLLMRSHMNLEVHKTPFSVLNDKKTFQF